MTCLKNDFSGLYSDLKPVFFWSRPMSQDLVLACILISIGAMLAYLADEQLQFTPRLAQWIGRVLDQD
jgi:hypothetical protein